MSNVGEVCKLQGDIAKEATNLQPGQRVADHIWIIGNIFEYAYTQACAKDKCDLSLDLLVRDLPN